MTAPSLRRSAAAARRLRQHATAARPRTLPPHLQLVADRFRPQGPLAHDWPAVRDATLEVLAAAGIGGVESVRKHLTHVGYFLAWALDQGHPAGAATVRRELVDEYARVGMPGSSEKSRADRRARLRNVADKLHPEQATRGVPIARASVKPPYTADEIMRITRVAITQPTAAQRRKLSLCVALGAGAGLDSPDLRHLRRRDLDDDPKRGITIHVTGPRARTVTVLRDYEVLLRHGVDSRGPDDLVLGVDEARRTIAARAISDATLLGDCPRIEQSRLRSTWLAHLLARRVPLTVVMRAAGLSSGRTLADLLPYLPEVTDPAAVLRDPEVAA